MSIFTIGDLHLSLDSDKPMDIFDGWSNYTQRLVENWIQLIKPEDTIILAGDTSWGMTLEQALGDFKFLEELPGEKIILKGNHDYWWSSRKKMEGFFEANGLNTITILHNNCVITEDIAICGTRGWMIEDSAPEDRKVVLREEGRLRASLEEALKTGLEPVVFLHYPPVFANNISGGIIEILNSYAVKRCFYGHLHGKSHTFSINGDYMGIEFALIAADYLKFKPLKVK